MSSPDDDPAYGIVSSARSMLCLDLRFLTRAVLTLDCRIVDGEGACACDGDIILFHRDTVISQYRTEPNRVARDIAHCALHCILGHDRCDNGADRDLAEDMTVSYILDSLKTPHTVVDGWEDRLFAFEKLVQKAGNPGIDQLTAAVSGISHYRREDYDRMFTVDDHSLRPGSGSRDWDEMSKQAMVEIEGFSKDLSDRSPLLLSILRIRNRRTHDYRAFLRRFMTVTNVVRENPDEFDYIYYSYGLRTYGNIPLIDSTEYSESPHVRVFAVAIDTSASTVEGNVVRFIEEAFSALRQTSVGTDSELHVIQCDDRIRSDITIRSEGDLLALAKDFELQGGGRTDFRPVFEHIAAEQEEGRYQGLGGLLYFTDGRGTFPDRKPDYECAFVLDDTSFDDSVVPSWAMRIFIDPEA